MKSRPVSSWSKTNVFVLFFVRACVFCESKETAFFYLENSLAAFRVLAMGVNFTPSFSPSFASSFAPSLLLDISCIHWPSRWIASRLHDILIYMFHVKRFPHTLNDLFFIGNVSHLFFAFRKVLNIMTIEITYMRRFYFPNVSTRAE